MSLPIPITVSIIVYLTALAVDAVSNDNLVAVIQLFRHGERTPNAFYANDPYSDSSYWEVSNGQLTNEGKRQQYTLGQFTRSRYTGWLSTSYDSNEFYAQTTDVDRTHMSAQTNVFGLYPAKGTQIWLQNVSWQPIPVHPVDTSIILNHLNTSCTAFHTERVNLLANDLEYVTLDSMYSDLYSYLTSYTGENVTSFVDIHDIYDTLKIESDVGFTLPSWTSAVYPSPLYDLTGYFFQTYSRNTKLQRLGTGPTFYTWLQYFDSMVKDPTSNPKFQMYSAHDFNIASILNALGGYSPPFPPGFASSLYLELRNTSYGSHYVNAWRKNNEEFVNFSILGCALNCSLSEFKRLLGDVPVDIATREAECLK